MHTAYKVDGLVKRAGPDLVLSVGRLIAQQRKIEGNDRQRTDDVVYEFSASNVCYDVEVELPEGYTVTSESLQPLNTAVATSCGRFEAKAEASGGRLRLTVVKRYEHAREPVANWPGILEFVDAATKFNAMQVVLTRQ